MSNILAILNEIEADAGKIYKQEVLLKHKDNETLKRVFVMAYSPNLVFHLKKMPAIAETFLGDYSLDDAFFLLEKMSNGEVSGNRAKEHMSDLLAGLGYDDQEVVTRIIAKDLHCGISAKSINKIHPFLVPITPYMGAIPFSEKKARKFFDKGGVAESDVKVDGRYANVIVDGGSIRMMSRQGKNSYVPSKSLITDVAIVNRNVERYGESTDFVFNGELLMEGVPRYAANGIIDSIISIEEKRDEGLNTTKEMAKFQEKHDMEYWDAVDRVYISVWDLIPLALYNKGEEWTVNRHSRLQMLEVAINQSKVELNKVELIEYKIVHNYEQAVQHFQELLLRGEEGTVLKRLDGIWENKKPTYQLKMKLTMTVDMKIIGFKQGFIKGKLSEITGSFLAENADGKVKTDPGALGKVLSKETWENKEKYLGRTIEVKCNGLSQNSDGVYSLLHPVFNCFRDDTTLDTLEDIKDNQDMVLGLKKSE